MNTTDKNFQLEVDPMIDAKQAACSLRLPLYWFADPKMRAKHRIPHYLLGGLVRFRTNELSTWAANNQGTGHAGADEQRPESDGNDEL